MSDDELLCPACGAPVGAGVIGAELHARYEKGRRAALDRMIEIADESGMYDLPPEREQEREQGRAAEGVQPNFSAAPKVEVEEKGEGSGS